MENENPDPEQVRPPELDQVTMHAGEEKSDLTPRFKLIFLTVAALTVLALILNVLLAVFGNDSEQVKAAVEACSTTYVMGFGAIVGLIGGKVA